MFSRYSFKEIHSKTERERERGREGGREGENHVTKMMVENSVSRYSAKRIA